MNNTVEPKLLSQTYLFNSYEKYQEKLFETIMKGTVYDKDAEGFDDIVYEVSKRRVPNTIIKVMKNPSIVFIEPPKPLPTNLDIFVAKDPKDGKKLKCFIDTTDLMYKNSQNGKLEIVMIDALICSLMQAMTSKIYYTDPTRFTMNNRICESGAECFAKLFTHIIDYLYKISNVRAIRNKCMYLAACYFLINIMGREDESESVYAIAMKISGLSERESDIIKIQLDSNSFMNIKFFVETVSNILKLDKLTVGEFIDKWMYIYGVRTVFALELFPNFSGMMTDVYVGSYMNNQKAIEKITGDSMVQFCKVLLEIGADSL